MVNLLRMDLYRMFKGKMLWVCLAIVVAVAAFATYMIWFMTSDAFTDMSSGNPTDSFITVGVTSNTGEELSAEDRAALSDMSQFTFVAQMLVSGGFLPLILALIAVLFCAGEFESGFVKNVFSVQGNRIAYFGSKLVVLLIVTVLFLALGTVAGLAFAAVAGLNLTVASIGDWMIWLALVVLALLAYEVLATALFWVTRSKVATLVVSILVTAGLVGSIITGLLDMFFPSLDLGQYLLYSCLQAFNLPEPSLSGMNVALVAGLALVYAIVGCVAGAFALKKKDV